MGNTRLSVRFFSISLIGFLVGIGATSHAARADSSGPEIDRAVIAEEVKKELRRLIDDEGFMDEAIRRGIESYIREQQEKQRAAAAARARAMAEKAKSLRPVSVERDHIYGDPNAPISLVEYSDFECPFCKRFHPTGKQLVDQNPELVNLVYRHFPLDFHKPGAEQEAEAAECAAEQGGSEAFWRYADAIYQRTTSNGRGFPVDRLVPVAEELGLDVQRFQGCLQSGRMAGRIQEDYTDGVKSGITGTPGLIYVKHESGDVVPAAGALPLAKLKAKLDQLSAKQAKEAK